MRTDADLPASVETEPAPELDEPSADLPRTRRKSRLQRKREHARRGLLGAILVCAVVPTVLVLSLWRSLTEPFGFDGSGGPTTSPIRGTGSRP